MQTPLALKNSAERSEHNMRCTAQGFDVPRHRSICNLHLGVATHHVSEHPDQWQAVVCARALEGTIIQNIFATLYRYPVNWSSPVIITSFPPASNGETKPSNSRSLTRSHYLSLCNGSISLPSYGSRVAQTFQLLHQLPLRSSLKSWTSDRQIHNFKKLLCRVECACEYLKHGAVFWNVACQDYVQTSFQH